MRLTLTNYKIYLLVINAASLIYLLLCIYINVTHKDFMNIYIYCLFVLFSLFFFLRIFHNFVFFFSNFNFNSSNILLYAPQYDPTDFSNAYRTIINNTPPPNTQPLLPIDPLKTELHYKFLKTANITMIAIGIAGIGISGYSLYLTKVKLEEDLLLQRKKVQVKQEKLIELRRKNDLRLAQLKELQKANENLSKLITSNKENKP
jgi:hypothetical protein